MGVSWVPVIAGLLAGVIWRAADGGDGGGEALDSSGDLLVGGLEGLVGVDAGRVGHGPVQPAAGSREQGGEFLVGVVADCDQEVVGPDDVSEVGWCRACCS